MLEDFKQHPIIAPLIADGKMVEYSAHVVPEAGLRITARKCCDEGVVLHGGRCGERYCMNLGFYH